MGVNKMLSYINTLRQPISQSNTFAGASHMFLSRVFEQLHPEPDKSYKKQAFLHVVFGSDNDGTPSLGVKTISGSVVTQCSKWHTYESFERDVLMLPVIFIIS